MFSFLQIRSSFFRHCCLFLLPLLLAGVRSQAQVTVTSDPTSGYAYSVTIKVEPKSVVPAGSGCTNGYNYDINYNYTITYTGAPPSSLYDLQFTFKNTDGTQFVNNPLPLNGSTNSGNRTTSRNQYRNVNDCATATPASLGTKPVTVAISGPGIASKTVTYSSAPLPVSLTLFTAQAQADGVLLRWATASELNNAAFVLERSSTGHEWQAVRQVAGAGTSTRAHSYELTDRPAGQGLYYYRLRQTDFDGTATFSPVRTVTLKAVPAVISLYPNPGQSAFLRVAGLADPAQWQAQLYSSLGRPVAAAVLTDEGLPVAALPAGVYVLRLYNAATGSTATARYVRQ